MQPEGNAIVYCQGAFNTANGKTAHGLVRFTERYNVLAVIDSNYEGQDALMVLDNKKKGIPIYGSTASAIDNAKEKVSHFVIGIAPDGGRITTEMKDNIKIAIQSGLNVDSGLHDFISNDLEMVALAQKHKVVIRDVRKPPEREKLHFFTGNIEKVSSLKIAVLGTDSAIGKRTTAWLIVHALQAAGVSAEMIGTGQTGWMQGAKYSIIMDSLINDFVSGEIENAVWQAWQEKSPEVIVVEGQGSLMNPAYPGGFEILAAARPDMVVLQHAPMRKEYDGFPGYLLHPLSKQIEAIQMVSGKPVTAITINHEDMDVSQVSTMCTAIEQITGLPAFDVLLHGADGLAKHIMKSLKRAK